MSESASEVRLVRCPKCENLLPEVTEYAVYQCGGCGAVLRASNKHIESGLSSEKSGDESDGVPHKISKDSVNLDFSKRTVKSMSLASESGTKSNGSSGRRHERDDSININLEEPKPQIANNRIGSRRSVRSSNWRYRDTNLQEASSSYQYAPRHEYAELVHKTNELEVEDDRDELLRKLDELKDQIVRSRDKSKDKFPINHHPPSYIDPPPYIHHNNHSSLPPSNQVQVFNDPFRSQNQRRPPISPFDQNPYPPYYSGQYVSNELPDNRLFHHPSCSCLVCYNNHHQAPPPPPPQPPPHPIAPPVLQNDPGFYRHDYNRSLNSRSGESRTRWSNDLRRPPRGILAAGVRRCRPVSGGSPFVACCKCYELLQVPKKNTKKMRCAACSEVMLLSIVNNKLILSVYTVTRMESQKARDDHRTRGDRKWGGTEVSSEDYDNSGNFDFESMDKLALGGPSLTSYKSAVSYTSEDELKGVIKEDENTVDVSVEIEKPLAPPSGSPLQDHFDYSTKYNRAGKGNISKRSDMEIPSKMVSMKDDTMASEIDISSNEYGVNTGTSLESGDASTDRQCGSESSFVGMIRKGLRDFSKSSQHVDQGKINVMVNGQPLPDRLVKKAEKTAGPIQPGEYWYDSKAGFWGMMGGPCRGIIPPFIEEFKYPMPEKCANGTTNVYVNGRELHERDLELLASRGLSTETDRCYIIEITGRVLDEETGEELEGLGKLAPTVERKKHGFGMKPPRATAV